MAKKKTPKTTTVQADPRTITVASGANNIRNWRLFRGIATQQELAKRTEAFDPEGGGIKRVTISRLESGECRYNQDHLAILAQTLRVSPRDLIGTDPFDTGDIFAVYAGLSKDKKRLAMELIQQLKA